MTSSAPHRPRRIAVVGNGMAGARFAEEVARRDPEGRRVQLSVVGAEPGPAYNRVLLTGVLEGTYRADDIALPEPAAGTATRRTGTAAVAVDPVARRVGLDDGGRLDYDDLVLATGARSALPPLPGVRAADGSPGAGVTALRTLADCARLQALVRPGAPAVVLGGGVLGLETARALAAAGVRVAVVESSPWIMRRQIDRAGADVLAAAYAALGVAVHSWRAAARWIPGTGLELDDGRVLAGDALVVTAGVRPAVELAEKAGLEVEGGMVVDDRLATSDPRIHAIGDCARHPGGGAGLVEPAYAQAGALADLLTGADPAARYTGARPLTRLKATGIDLTAMGAPGSDGGGLSGPEEGAGEMDTVTVSDPRRGRYARLDVRDGRISGAVLLGFPDAAPEVARIFESGAAVPEDRLALLQGLPAAAPHGSGGAGEDLPVCRCNGVAREEIEAAWLDGARTRTSVARATRATTGCGGCIRDVDALLAGLEAPRAGQQAAR